MCVCIYLYIHTYIHLYMYISISALIVLLPVLPVCNLGYRGNVKTISRASPSSLGPAQPFPTSPDKAPCGGLGFCGHQAIGCQSCLAFSSVLKRFSKYPFW